MARFWVGPESAGAFPGPACYRNGGPLTLTDCHVMLGRIAPAHFPHVFGPGGDAPLDAEVARRKFAELAQDIAAATCKQHSPEQVVESFLAVAVENMARAIKKISTERGYDVSRYTLVCFGGAAGKPGENRVERADGRVEVLDSCDEVALNLGDRFIIETPGGGDFGTAGAAG